MTIRKPLILSLFFALIVLANCKKGNDKNSVPAENRKMTLLDSIALDPYARGYKKVTEKELRLSNVVKKTARSKREFSYSKLLETFDVYLHSDNNHIYIERKDFKKLKLSPLSFDHGVTKGVCNCSAAVACYIDGGRMVDDECENVDEGCINLAIMANAELSDINGDFGPFCELNPTYDAWVTANGTFTVFTDYAYGYTHAAASTPENWIW